MVKDYRYRISKNNSSWDKAVKVFDKSLKDLPDEVLEQLYEIFQMDVPAGRNNMQENKELIKKLKSDIECLTLQIQILKMRSA